MKKKLIISSYDDLKNPYYGGGGAKAIHEVARRLVAEYTVTVLTGNYTGATATTQDGVVYQPIGPTINHPQFGQLVYQCVLPIAALRTPHDIWIESFTPPFSTAFLPWFTKKPVIGLAHLLSGKAMANKYKLPIFPWIEKLGLNQYHHLIALTPVSKKRISELSPHTHINVIPNGVDLEGLQESLQEGTCQRDCITFLGRIDIRQKGLDLLITAYSQTAHELPYDLYIAGGGRPKVIQRLKKMIAASPVADRIHYLGHIDGPQKYVLLRRSALMIVPSRYETQPLVLFESFAAKSPVLTFDITDLKWISPQYCLKAAVQSTTALADQILWAVKHPKQLAEQARRASSFVEHFDWDLTAQKYNQYISATLKQYSEAI